MFKKPKKTIVQQRRRQDDDDEEDGESQSLTTEDVDVQPKQTITQKLSFAHEDDDKEEEVTVKKSSYSRRMAKQLEKDRKKRLKEVREKEARLEDKKAEDKIKKNEDLEVIFVNSDKVRKEDVPEVIQIPDEDHFSDDSEDEDSGGLRFRSVVERGAIPDASTIFALKKQRQSRKHNDDFIALQDETNRRRNDVENEEEEEYVGKKDQYDMEFEDEEEERIEFDQLKVGRIDRHRAKEAIELAQEEEIDLSKPSRNRMKNSDSESDDEITRWEKEQIMKGVGSGNVSSMIAKVEAEYHGNQLMEVSSSPGHSPRFEAFTTSTEHKMPSYLHETFDMVAIDDVLDLIQELVDEKKEKISYMDRHLTDLAVEEKVLQEDLERTEGQVKDLEKRRKELHEKLKQIELDQNDIM